ncbi:MAG: extracellular solute-binding protein [Clostridiales bacterium]|jgi:putative aldouronate transport system substrate-binding protein|nr:extracellular solute-binding protein [Clostridiales bacterium]
MKKLLAPVLACLLAAGLMAGCGTASESTDAAAPSASVHPMRFVTPGTTAPEQDAGVKAVNEKLAADGVDIEFTPIRIPWDAYDQKLNLMLSSGDEFELLHVMQDVKNISSLASRDALLPVDEYLDKYPGLVAKFNDDEWRAGVYQGKTFAVPCSWRSFDNALGYMTVRTDTMKKFTDTFPGNDVDAIIDLMKKMQADIETEVGKKPFHWPHQLAMAPGWLHRTYDTFPFYVENSIGIVLTRQDGTVDSYYESEEFKKDAQTYRTLYTSGLIHPDILNATHQQKYDEIKIGAALPSETFGYGDLVALRENIPEADLEVFFTAPEKPHMIYTLSQNLNAISATAEDPESGLKFLNWLYASKENHDLFHYGIPEVHYTASADNRIQRVKDEANNNLYEFDTWMTGYLPFLRYDETMPEKGIEFDQFKADNKVVSPAAPFLFDASNVEAELTAIQTEIIASIYPIKFGLVDYDASIDAAISRLKAAGIDRYLEEYKAQFAEFLKQNPDALE